MKENQEKKNMFIESYEKYANDIFRYCVYRVFDRERAKELMQESFTKTWQYMGKDKEIDNMRAFLYKVAHNLCVNEIIRPKAYSLDGMEEKKGFDPEDKHTSPPEMAVETSLLLKKMEFLSPKFREILKLRYIDDLTVSEIAKLLNMIPNTVSVNIRRAEELLRELYNK